MTANLNPLGVGDILGVFFVPAYQRGYRWGNDEVTRLLDDIWASDGRTYYLQPVVVKPMNDGRWELVDGQQRLTTLFLIFQYMRRAGLQSTGASFSLHYETRPGSASYLEQLDEEASTENIDFWHIRRAYDCIEAWFDAFEHRKQFAANKFYGYLFETVKVIWYEAAKDVDSTTLFTRLNVGRIPLTDAELVKALLLSRSGERPGQADRREQIAAQWDAFERDLRSPEVWSFITGKAEEAPTHISLLLDTLADREVRSRGGDVPSPERREPFFTFETLRPIIDGGPDAPQDFWDEVVRLHSLLLGWYEDRDLFHKIGYLVAQGDDLGSIADMARDLTKKELHEALNLRIRQRLGLTRSRVSEINYESTAGKCSQVLLLMNVETVRRRTDSFERYSFHAHAAGAWTLEHIHAQHAEPLTRARQWADWLQLHRDAVTGLPGLEPAWRDSLLARIDSVLFDIADARVSGVEEKFRAVEADVIATLSAAESSGEDGVHSLANLALLDSRSNSALSNSVFEVKRRKVLELDKAGAYIPACTRNVFLKYYTTADDQQLHFWSERDREAYMDAMFEMVGPYLTEEDLSA